MDPQVTWEQLLHAFACDDWPAVSEHATALNTWLHRGGFPPKIIAEPCIGDPFNHVLALSACEFALAQAAEKGWPP